MTRTGERDEFVDEWLTDDAASCSARASSKNRTPYQRLEVFDTPELGRMFRLDGCNMTSERDEFFYHENIVHIGALAQDAPKRALIVGGGDGGSAEELLKHPRSSASSSRSSTPRSCASRASTCNRCIAARSTIRASRSGSATASPSCGRRTNRSMSSSWT
jgi:hypothetical protein